MHRIAVFFAGALGAVALMAPFASWAVGPGITAGGRILTIFPCLNGAFYMTVLSSVGPTAGSVIPYTYQLGVPTVYAGPPRNPGQEIAGFALPAPIPSCVLSYTPPVILPAIPFTYLVGTSLY